MVENLGPDFIKNNKGFRPIIEDLTEAPNCKFENIKRQVRENSNQDLIDGINIMNRETISEVASVMNNSSSVKLYSSKAYENTSKNFCERLTKMGIEASFYDINEGKNTDSVRLNDLTIVNSFKLERELCDRILTAAKKKYAKTVSINEEESVNANADYNIYTFSLREKNDTEVVKSVLDCLSFAAFTNKII